MRHKWKKRNSEFILDKNGRVKTTIRKCHVCIKCGLKKGNAYSASNSGWYDLIYYNDYKILSKSILPFKCIGNNMKEMLLTEEDFEL